MQNLHFTIDIQAPREKVWHAMLDDAPYREWTGAFMPGSYYQGDWSEGSIMRFLGPSESGDTEKEGGMIATVKENRPAEFISLEYSAVVESGIETSVSAGSLENYTFTDTDDGTEVRVDLMNLPEEYVTIFSDTWPKALEMLKEVAER